MGSKLTKKRTIQSLNSLFNWAVKYDQTFFENFVAASGLSMQEIDALADKANELGYE